MNLKPESLEALLLDRSLGVLTPEAEELLTSYLETQPMARLRAEEFQAATCLAKKALTLGPSIPLPEPRFKTMEKPGAWPGRPSAYLPWLAAAACLVVGFGLAKLSPSVTMPAIQPHAVAAIEPMANSNTQTNERSFWLTSHLASTAPAHTPNSPYVVVWDSPLKKPRIKSTL